MGRLEGSGPGPETHLSQGHLQGSQAHLESGLPGQPVIIDPSSIYLEGDGRTNPVTLRTAPERPLALGYEFAYPELEPALRDALGKR